LVGKPRLGLGGGKAPREGEAYNGIQTKDNPNLSRGERSGKR